MFLSDQNNVPNIEKAGLISKFSNPCSLQATKKANMTNRQQHS